MEEWMTVFVREQVTPGRPLKQASLFASRQVSFLDAGCFAFIRHASEQ